MYDKAKEQNLSDVANDMGFRIQTSRRAVRLTQGELAEAVGVSTQYISNLERGLVGASTDTVIKLCEALRVSCDYILTGRETDLYKESYVDLSSLSESQLNEVSNALNMIFTSRR